MPGSARLSAGSSGVVSGGIILIVDRVIIHGRLLIVEVVDGQVVGELQRVDDDREPRLQLGEPLAWSTR